MVTVSPLSLLQVLPQDIREPLVQHPCRASLLEVGAELVACLHFAVSSQVPSLLALLNLHMTVSVACAGHPRSRAATRSTLLGSGRWGVLAGCRGQVSVPTTQNATTQHRFSADYLVLIWIGEPCTRLCIHVHYCAYWGADYLG